MKPNKISADIDKCEKLSMDCITQNNKKKQFKKSAQIDDMHVTKNGCRFFLICENT